MTKRIEFNHVPVFVGEWLDSLSIFRLGSDYYPETKKFVIYLN
jgi:hypothetical protein